MRRLRARRAGHLHDLRPALARRPLADGPARTRSAARGSPSSSSTGDRWRTPRLRRGRRARAVLAATARAGPRGRRRQAAGLARTSRAGAARVGEGQERPPPGGRHRRLAAGGGAPARPHRRAARRRATRTATLRYAGPRRHRASPRPSSTGSRRCSARWSATPSPFDARPDRRRRREAVWVEPRLVAEVEFREWTHGGHAARARPTRACATTRRRSRSSASARRPKRADGRRSTSTAARSSSPTSTRSSIRRPASRKRDVIDYYVAIAPVLLPHLAGRPLTLKRYPNGVDGHVLLREERAVAPARLGADRDACRRAARRSTSSLARGPSRRSSGSRNLADLELHTSLARADDIRPPDDARLRPRPGRARDDRRVLPRSRCCSRDVRAASGCRRFAKTSGSKGMQVYVPLNDPT